MHRRYNAHVCVVDMTLTCALSRRAGDKEVRAWTIQAGTLAPQAAGVIHQDFERTVQHTDNTAHPRILCGRHCRSQNSVRVVIERRLMRYIPRLVLVVSVKDAACIVLEKCCCNTAYLGSSTL